MSVVVKGLYATVLTAVITLSLALAAGCARRGAEQPPEPEPTQTTDVLLPEWAPENPSPEFLRAARVLKPLPTEVVEQMPDLPAALKQRYVSIICPASYEFFGTLTDQQIEQFMTTKEIRVPVKDLTKPQRRALDAWFAAFRDAVRGWPLELDDYLIMLYKMGAKEDLSNVRVGFQAQGGHAVHIAFWVTPPGGKEDYICTWFAQI